MGLKSIICQPEMIRIQLQINPRFWLDNKRYLDFAQMIVEEKKTDQLTCVMAFENSVPRYYCAKVLSLMKTVLEHNSIDDFIAIDQRQCNQLRKALLKLWRHVLELLHFLEWFDGLIAQTANARQENRMNDMRGEQWTIWYFPRFCTRK